MTIDERDSEKLQEYIDPVKALFETIDSEETAQKIWLVFHKLSIAAMSKANEIRRHEFDVFEKKIEDLKRIHWKNEMKKQGYITGGNKKRKNRKKPKLKLLK